MRRYNFNERLEFSHGVAASRSVQEILTANIPGAMNVTKAGDSNDRDGTDWWVEVYGRHLRVDCKVREEDWLKKAGKDDLALETYSVVEKGVPGWTRNEKKHTDYILWLWVDTGRWCLISFPQLCAVYQDKWELWRTVYPTCQQDNGDYRSECTFVPRKAVWKAMYKRFGGDPSPGD